VIPPHPNTKLLKYILLGNKYSVLQMNTQSPLSEFQNCLFLESSFIRFIYFIIEDYTTINNTIVHLFGMPLN